MGYDWQKARIEREIAGANAALGGIAEQLEELGLPPEERAARRQARQLKATVGVVFFFAVGLVIFVWSQLDRHVGEAAGLTFVRGVWFVIDKGFTLLLVAMVLYPVGWVLVRVARGLWRVAAAAGRLLGGTGRRGRNEEAW